MQDISGIPNLFSHENKRELFELFKGPWQWMFTGNLEWEVSFEEAERAFKSWRQIAAKETHLQLTSIGIYSRKANKRRGINKVGNTHCHVLLMGSNRKGETLYDVPIRDRYKLQYVWEKIAHKTGVISVAYNEEVEEYPVENIIMNPSGEIGFIHNMKVLKKLKAA